jgi:hypothetical protein
MAEKVLDKKAEPMLDLTTEKVPARTVQDMVNLARVQTAALRFVYRWLRAHGVKMVEMPLYDPKDS